MKINLRLPTNLGVPIYDVTVGTKKVSTGDGQVHGLSVTDGATVVIDAPKPKPTPPPPPPPPPSGSQAGSGAVRYGSSYAPAQATDLAKLSVVLADLGSASVPKDIKAVGGTTRSLLYRSAVSCKAAADESIPYATALANNWLLKAPGVGGAPGPYLHNIGYPDSYILDISNPSVSAAVGNDAVAQARQFGFTGVWFDDVVAQGANLTGIAGATVGTLPAGWTQVGWYNALVAHILRVGAVVKGSGLKMACNANGGFAPDNTDSQEEAFWRLLAPGLDGVTCEYWEEVEDGPVFTINKTNWMGHWDSWRGLHKLCQELGLAFLPIVYGAPDSAVVTYVRATFLLDYDGGDSALLLFDSANPITGVWSANMGAATDPAAVISGQVYSRAFTKGRVAINPYTGPPATIALG